MPLFEYDCTDCGQQVELLIRADETPICPACASERLTKRLSVPAAPAVAGRSSPLPMVGGCDSTLPPCSPTCCRIPGMAD